MNNYERGKKKAYRIATKGSRHAATFYWGLFLSFSNLVLNFIYNLVLDKDIKQVIENPTIESIIVMSLSIIWAIAAIILICIEAKQKLKMDLGPINNSLQYVCDLFNTAIMPDADARIHVYILIKVGFIRRKSIFCKLCTTEAIDKQTFRNVDELKCFDAYTNKKALCVDLSNDERKKSQRSDIKSVFALPITNLKGNVIGVVSIDTKQKFEECYALKKKQQDISKLLENLQGISDHLIAHLLTGGKK